MMARRYVFANPRFAAAHPSRALPDLEIDGGDLAIAFTADEDTVVGVFTAEGGARVAEVILRYLAKAGFAEEAKRAIEQATLELAGGSKPTLVVPKNTIQRAIMLPPETPR